MMSKSVSKAMCVEEGGLLAELNSFMFSEDVKRKALDVRCKG